MATPAPRYLLMSFGTLMSSSATPVNDYLTRIQLTSNDVFDVSKITVRKLLSHSAGLNNGGFTGYSDVDDFPSVEEVLENVEVVNEPGSVWSYSNLGFGILQILMDKI